MHQRLCISIKLSFRRETTTRARSLTPISSCAKCCPYLLHNHCVFTECSLFFLSCGKFCAHLVRPYFIFLNIPQRIPCLLFSFFVLTCPGWEPPIGDAAPPTSGPRLPGGPRAAGMAAHTAQRAATAAAAGRRGALKVRIIRWGKKGSVV